jgi:DNA-binding CsgD family transcriptional regulator
MAAVEPRSGHDLLAAGEWEAARAAFEDSLARADDPEAHDGLGIANWWLRDVDGAVAERALAHAGFAARGETERAARIAMWLAVEYTTTVGNEPIGAGWLARAERTTAHLPPGPIHGWLAVTRARLAVDPSVTVVDTRSAVEVAVAAGDPDLEATALAFLGLATVFGGGVEDGMRYLDEAMAVATGGGVIDHAVFGDVCCVVTRAAEESADVERLARWNETVMTFMERTGHAPLLEFCGTCCAEVLLANGDLTEAEGWLVRTLTELEGSARARCVHPAAKLAELRLLQGRVEEAARLLQGFEDRADALRASAAVAAARGEHAVATALLLRRLGQVGDSLLAVPLLAALVDVQLDRGDAVGAAESANQLATLSARFDAPRVEAASSLAAGRVAAAAGDPEARGHLERSLEIAEALSMPLAAATARLELAGVLSHDEPELARREATLAYEAFDAAGAGAPADRAAAVLRELGGPARTGPRAIGSLSNREREVLGLLAEGLTNAEIAVRLFISTKTAGHHVSAILSKLGLRNRSEAAAYALRLPTADLAPR